MSSNGDSTYHKLSGAGLLIALGIVYGDIGTSPLYVIKAIVGESIITNELIYGGVSCVFWTLTLQTTLKYILLTLEADNKGEGGIFALYALVRRRGRWLAFPAMIGGAALLADGIITPPISVSAAIEGLRILDPNIQTIPIVILILIILFSVQRFGTERVGVSFGPVMLLWFSMLSILGVIQIIQTPQILISINPYWALNLLLNYPGGFWVLGAVFLATTGAEALYSDLGHCGKTNIRVSWIFVKTSLLLNYFGQSAWLIPFEGAYLEDRNPFFQLMPQWFVIPGIVIATAATIIASQALISGSYTLVSEATRLFMFPKVKISYPTEFRGQVYVPLVNIWMLFACIGIVLYFKESSRMEAAYGLSIIIDMIMTTVLFTAFLLVKRVSMFWVAGFVLLFGAIEGAFLVANISKFFHGGYITLIIASIIFTVMLTWYKASLLKRRYTEYTGFTDHLPALKDLSRDKEIEKFSSHLVYMTGSAVSGMIESKIIHSIFRKKPKRADVYWFVHVNVTDDPHTLEYAVEPLIEGIAYRIEFFLGFRVEPRINLLFRKAIEELSKNNEIDIVSRYPSLRTHNIPADFRFVVLERALSYENELPPLEQLVMDGYFFLRKFSLTEPESFGLDTSNVVVERVPLMIAPVRGMDMKRVDYGDL